MVNTIDEHTPAIHEDQAEVAELVPGPSPTIFFRITYAHPDFPKEKAELLRELQRLVKRPSTALPPREIRFIFPVDNPELREETLRSVLYRRYNAGRLAMGDFDEEMLQKFPPEMHPRIYGIMHEKYRANQG